MQYTIDDLRKEIFGKVYEVYDIFLNFFGERFTDLQEIPGDLEFKEVLGNYDIDVTQESFEVSDSNMAHIKEYYSTLKPFILVWWPNVRVTNENDKSVVIQDLYAKIDITMEGRIPYENRGFRLTRTTFSNVQYRAGYIHSHTPHFFGIPSFENPCLGTGPINNTILDLKNGYEETLWMLFCQELALYVTVESLHGGPYQRLENLGASNLNTDFTDYDYRLDSIGNIIVYLKVSDDREEKMRTILHDFTLYYLTHGNLSLGYKDGKYIPGMPYFDFMVDISNAFIDFYNRQEVNVEKNELFDKYFLRRVLAANNRFYILESSNVDLSDYEGKYILTFKGENKFLHIEHEQEQDFEETTLLNNKIAMFILNNVLKIINYRYRNEHNKQLRGSSKTTVAPTYQTVIYL